MEVTAETISKLESSEMKLKELQNIATKTWISTYYVLAEIDAERQFAGQYKSFSAWLKSYCSRINQSESYYWSLLKAGRYYSELQQADQDLPDLRDAQLTPDNLVYISKLAQGDKAQAVELLHKVMQKQIMKKDLKSMWIDLRSTLPAQDKPQQVQKNEKQEPQQKPEYKLTLTWKTWFILTVLKLRQQPRLLAVLAVLAIVLLMLLLI